ncbi:MULTISPECIES: flagellar basal-body rod protein FlgG [Shewanella]|jgi:flagellar basal-body rod protein FlgG|uniref:Flagellar basal-body rod protein FlgG n=1 Tax=Shewanella fodinae TaxID=552357 RepID=A0A4R2FBJ7_9GAMM|nr:MULTISPECIES: flagellar basal-body rod protein FlgG [Shewanella]MDN5370295.1 flagellar basal-body rod protein FlgG [Shewanella sp.]MBO1272387.1 flagellar basal-body rod protein FlgG [Shewanella sp. 4t3-1-2LB]MCL2906344.1 flagellar basal-body rod protein FlgG [Shewanella fodinae]TCN85818.1 flagellar basal-body rod protein FlgG [Shewanella fodinae]GGZ12040.1 flagellar basal-body rod protein FlgG [Shewanella fodinae]
MHPALWISKTGLDAQQTDISVISNNVANASTVGYKKGRAVFEDLLYQTVNQAGGISAANTKLPNGLNLGAGTKVVSTQKIFSQGNMETTDNSMDLMIQGPGFFEIQMPDGTTAYTRNGQFTLDDTGQMVTSGEGYVLQPGITIPDNATSITVSEEGEVSVKIPGNAENQVVGQLTMSDFINPSGLQPIGQNLYLETGASGTPVQGTPSLDGLGSIRQGSLETSNVNVTEELVNLIESQRVYEMNSKVISAVDQMLAYVNQNL